MLAPLCVFLWWKRGASSSSVKSCLYFFNKKCAQLLICSFTKGFWEVFVDFQQSYLCSLQWTLGTLLLAPYKAVKIVTNVVVTVVKSARCWQPAELHTEPGASTIATWVALLQHSALQYLFFLRQASGHKCCWKESSCRKNAPFLFQAREKTRSEHCANQVSSWYY